MVRQIGCHAAISHTADVVRAHNMCRQADVDNRQVSITRVAIRAQRAVVASVHDTDVQVAGDPHRGSRGQPHHTASVITPVAMTDLTSITGNPTSPWMVHPDDPVGVAVTAVALVELSVKQPLERLWVIVLCLHILR